MNWSQFRQLIIENLSDDLLDKKRQMVRRNNPNLPATYGHCYVASEAAYYMMGGKEEGWKPQHIHHMRQSHWFLKHETGFILDITRDQFSTPIDYSEAKGIGFLTQQPSKRAKKLLNRIRESGRLSDLQKLHAALTA
jgi:hypothetical protein